MLQLVKILKWENRQMGSRKNNTNNQMETKKTKIIMGNESRNINCDMLKLSRTMFNKQGDKYTQQEMYEMGFELKEKQ